MKEKRCHLLLVCASVLINRHENATFSKLHEPDVAAMIIGPVSGRVEKLIEPKD